MSLAMWPQAEHALRLRARRGGRPDRAAAAAAGQAARRSGVQGIGALAALCAARVGTYSWRRRCTWSRHRQRCWPSHWASGSAPSPSPALPPRAGPCAGPFVPRQQSAGGLAVLADQDGACQAAELPDLDRRCGSVGDQRLPPPAGRRDASAGSGDPAGDDPLAACYAAGDQLTRWTWERSWPRSAGCCAGTGRLAVLPLGPLAWLPVTAAVPLRPPPPCAVRAGAARPPLPGLTYAAALAAAGSRPGAAPGRAGPRVRTWGPHLVWRLGDPHVLDEARQVAPCIWKRARSAAPPAQPGRQRRRGRRLRAVPGRGRR